MRRFEDPHALLRDHMLGLEAKRVIDAEFREVHAPAGRDYSGNRLSTLRDWLRRKILGA